MFQKFWKQSLVVLILLATTSEAGPVSYHGDLSTSGKWIIGDNHGQPAQLRGMSLYWSNENNAAAFYNANTISYLRNEWKSDVVRAAMAIDANWGGGQVGYLIDPTANKNRVIAVIEAAIANDMYVIIDWHDHDAHLHSSQALSFFTEMAQTYGSYDNVIFEIWNEPLNVSWNNTIKPYAQPIINAIRTYSDNLIVVGTPNWSQDVDAVVGNELTGGNIAYTLHFYANTHAGSLRTKAQTALNNNIPIFVTEWGTVDANGNGTVNTTESNLWLAFLDQNKISWANWSLNDLSESSCALVDGANVSGSNWVTTTSGSFVKAELLAKQQDYTSISSSSSVVASSSSAVGGGSMVEGFNYERIDMIALGATEQTLGYWYSYVDTYGSTITPNDSATIASEFGDGALSVSISLAAEVPMSSQYPFAGIAFDFINNGMLPDASKATVNLSTWNGISVTYTASSAVVIEMGEARSPDGAEYNCVLPATIGVSTVSCLWADFAQPAWAATNVPPLTRPLPTSAVTGFKFAYKTGSSSNNFSLHQIDMLGSGLGTFIADAAPVEPSSSSSVVSSSSSPVSSSVALSSSSVPVSSSSQALSSSVPQSSSSSVPQSSSSAPLATGFLEGFDYERIDFVPVGILEENIGYWYTYIDTYGSTMSPTDSASVATNFGDASSGLEVVINLAPEVPASLQYPFAGVGFDFINNGMVPDASKATIDLSTWSGITVTYSASAAIILEMGEARTADGAEYNCVLPATFGTNTITCLWADFAQPAWASGATIRPMPIAAITGFKFAYKTGSSSNTFTLQQLDLFGSGLGVSIADEPAEVIPPVSSSSVPASSSSQAVSSSVVVSSSSTPISSSVAVSSSSAPLSSSSQALSSSSVVLATGYLEGFDYERIDFIAPGLIEDQIGYWYTYIDTYGSTMSPNDSASVAANFGDLSGALEITISLAPEVPASLQYPFAGVGFDFANNGALSDPFKTTVDLTSWSGIAVTYSAINPVIVEMGEARTADGAEYNCILPSTFGVVQTQQCLWTVFAQPTWAATAVPPLTRAKPTAALTGFKFAYKTGSSSQTLRLYQLDLLGSGLGISIVDAPPVVVPPSSSSAVVSSSSSPLSSSVVVSSSSAPLSSSVVVSSSSAPLSSSVVVSSSSTPLSSSVVVSSSSAPLSSSSQALSSSVPQSSSSAPVIIGGTIEGFNTNRVDFVAPGVLAENRGYWYTYVDAFGSLISPNGETELIGAFDGTLDMGILLAAEVPALNQYPFAGVGFDFVDNGLVADPLKATVDLSSWQGISVTYASTTPLFLEMGEARTPDGAEYFCLLPATGGTVTHNCLWTAFAQPGWASGALIRPMPVSALTGFKFAYKTGNSGSNFYLESLDLIGNGLGSSVADEVEGPVISVQFAENSGFKILGFAGNSLEYILNQSGLYQIQITDLFGRILESHELNATAGIQELQLRQNYATGAYFVRLVQNSRVSSARINIQN